MAHLRLSERKAIETGWNAGDSIAEIAAKIGRSPPTVAREIQIHSPDGLTYDAVMAQHAAQGAQSRRVGHSNAFPRKAGSYDS